MTNLVQNIAKIKPSGNIPKDRSIYSTNNELSTLNHDKLTVAEERKNVPLGNTTNNFATAVSQRVKKPELTEAELSTLKYDFKKHKIELKKRIGEFVPRVGHCGSRRISKNAQNVQIVKGEKGNVYYAGMQRCGSVHLCPDCMYKLMKTRSEELYDQLKVYREQDKTVLFITFTLQHNIGDRLKDLHKTLLDAFTYANSHRSWIEAKKTVPVEFLRVLEVLYGVNGWHPHLHCLFVGDPQIEETIKIFIDLYRTRLKSNGLICNEHTVVIEKWNGTLDKAKDYLFKGKLEEELTGGGLKKTGKGKTFFDLIEENNVPVIKEYIEAIKGKRQYHHSKGFFSDVRVRTDEEIIKDDKVSEVLFEIPIKIYSEIHYKGISLHLLNEYVYGGIPRMTKLLELYDIDTSFMTSPG